MKSILFPTNFTELSFNAFTYALTYAKVNKARLIIFHSHDASASVTEETQKFYKQIDIQNFVNKKDKFAPFEEIALEEGAEDVKIKYVVKSGPFIPSLKKYIARKEDKIDLVIMGTHENERHLFEIFMETNTIKVLEEINKPVLAIPEKAKFDKKFDNIAFLVDYEEDERGPLLEIIRQAQEFNAQLTVIHFDLAHGDSISPRMENLKKSISAEHLPHVEFISIDSIDIKTSVQNFCIEKKIDMLCLINHRRNFYQRLFSYSLTQELLNGLDIPLMAIYRD